MHDNEQASRFCQQVIAAGRRKCFYIYDLAASRVEKVQGILGRPEKSFESFVTCPSSSNPLVAFLGNEGCVPLVSLKSRQSVTTLKMSGTVRTAAFTATGQELLTAGMSPAHFVFYPQSSAWAVTAGFRP